MRAHMLRLMTSSTITTQGRKQYSRLKIGHARANVAPKALPEPLVLALRPEDAPQCAWNNACAAYFVPVFINYHNGLGVHMSPQERLSIAVHGTVIKKMFKNFVVTLRKRFKDQVDPPTPKAVLVEDMENATSVRCTTVRLISAYVEVSSSYRSYSFPRIAARRSIPLSRS